MEALWERLFTEKLREIAGLSFGSVVGGDERLDSDGRSCGYAHKERLVVVVGLEDEKFANLESKTVATELDCYWFIDY